MRWGIGLLAAVLLLGGCATTVTGSAKPVPGQGPVLPDPCSFVSAEQAAQLKLKLPPRKLPVGNGIHPNCSWDAADDAYSLVHLNATWSLDESISNYLGGALPKETFQLGGLTWTRYPTTSDSTNDCFLATKLGPEAFFSVDALTQDTDPCAYPKLLAAVVAAYLPGGSPAPPVLTPPTRPAPKPGPLVGMDACKTLTAEEATQLALVPAGVPRKPLPSEPDSVGCVWSDTDGPGKQSGLVIWLAPGKPAKDWNDGQGQPLEVGGRQWSLVPNVNNSRELCSANLAVTETSSVQVSAGYAGDLDRMCDLVKATLPLVGAHIPG